MEVRGFKKLMIRDVPVGVILNAETADSFPLKECGTWISDDSELMIEEVIGSPEIYRLRPYSIDTSVKFFDKLDMLSFEGSIGAILLMVEKYYRK